MNYLIIDLETTGLDPKADHILEVGVCVINSNLNVYERNSWVLQRRSFLGMGEWCRKQHTSTGLVNEAINSELLLDGVEAELLQLVKRYWADDEKVVIAGNSIQFDRKFIEENFRHFSDRLHYRMLDITSVRMFIEDLCNAKLECRNRETHRATEDISDSFELLVNCVNIAYRG